jgi:hypothetical protein
MTVPAKTIFVDQLISGQQFQDIFLVSKKVLAETKAGKPYLALALMDRSGEVEARSGTMPNTTKPRRRKDIMSWSRPWPSPFVSRCSWQSAPCNGRGCGG